ncbi:hypothetical protein LO80_07870 [Candidatus Francisella endociliophora]|uniref:Uncharacterized protein n=1 Tax=Candidatus Francisella endociliophora TaxID=653937 RepID=A0A097EQR6_9GAMM|nr:DUF3281 family protein [Francisella sp. FSC1006]AIT09891.1 hypothetical protein LO80_07870 [Francisella sp. FSC1006]
MLLFLSLNSCIKTEDEIRVELLKQCINNLCSFQLVESRVRVSTDILGKEHIQTLSQKPLSGLLSSVEWSFPGDSNQTTSSALTAVGLPACQTDSCSDIDNPTGRDFGTSWGSQDISVTGTATLSNGKVVNINESSSFYVFPTQITYDMPTGSTITATEAASLFANASAAVKDNIAEVIGNGGTDGTLTFICKEGYFMDPNAIGLANGAQPQSRFSWPDIETEAPTPAFNGTYWEQIGYIEAANNAELDLPSGRDYGTALDCGIPK